MNTTITTFKPIYSQAAITEAFERMKDAESIYKRITEQNLSDFGDFMAQHKEMELTLAEISQVTGVSTSKAGGYFHKKNNRERFIPGRKEITRRFVEVDENGNIVPNGGMVRKTKTVVTYRHV